MTVSRIIFYLSISSQIEAIMRTVSLFLGIFLMVAGLGGAYDATQRGAILVSGAILFAATVVAEAIGSDLS